jgi:F-type H+-transporting ATPase subunit alpha
VEQQVALIYLGTQGLLKDVPVTKVREFEEIFLLKLEQLHPEALADFKAGKLSDSALATVTRLAGELAQQYKQ